MKKYHKSLIYKGLLYICPRLSPERAYITRVSIIFITPLIIRLKGDKWGQNIKIPHITGLL